MIGTKVASMILDSRELQFYKVRVGSLQPLLHVRLCHFVPTALFNFVIEPHVGVQHCCCSNGSDFEVWDCLQYDGDFRAKLDEVRAQLNAVAEGWTREEKDSCLDETEKSFKYSGGLLRTITES